MCFETSSSIFITKVDEIATTATFEYTNFYIWNTRCECKIELITNITVVCN